MKKRIEFSDLCAVCKYRIPGTEDSIFLCLDPEARHLAMITGTRPIIPNCGTEACEQWKLFEDAAEI